MIPSPQGYVHASAISVDGAGILIRGASRAGKSVLADTLIIAAETAGHTALLIGDDRVQLVARNGEVLLFPHPEIAGLIERRGQGIEAVPYASAIPLRLIIDLGASDPVEENASLPVSSTWEQVLGLDISRVDFPVRPAVADVLPLVLAAVAK